ncbi:MAG: Gfo/Idh/MocA family oxidoreductase [Acidobacteria bacterium]|nr:Gfo/Idh/MocA family oxidoreductase [Acidobacteriota bacterium]
MPIPAPLARREFLKQAAGAAVWPAIVPASALGLNGATPPSDRIVMGAIGVGRMGTGDMRGFLQHEDVRMAAVCDAQESAQARAKDVVDTRNGDNACARYGDYRELLARKDIDAVLIATGERWHPSIVIEAARQGKHIYCEKPLAVSVGEAKAARAAVRRVGVAFQFGTQQRSSQYYRFAVELARNGRIGELKKVLICSNGGYGYARPLPPEETKDPPRGFDWDMWLGAAPWAPYSEPRVSGLWMSIADYGLGHMGGLWGVHDVDIAQWVNDADHTTPVSVEGTGVYHSDIRDTAYIYDIEYRYASGVIVEYMDLSTAKRKYEQFRYGAMASCFVGTKGWVYVAREGVRTHPDSLMRSFIGPHEVRVIHSNDHKRNLLDAIKSGQKTISTVEAAAHDEMMCQMGDIAMRLKRKLRWDPVQEFFPGDEDANRRLARSMRAPWRIDL